MTRQSEDEPEVFGTYVHLRDENDGILRSTPIIRQLPAETQSKKVDTEEFLQNQLEAAPKRDLLTQCKENRKQKLAPVLDAERFETYVKQREGKKEIYMKEAGKFPYSFYMVNRVMFVGNHMAKGKSFSTKSLEEYKPPRRKPFTKEDAYDQVQIYKLAKSKSAKQLLENDKVLPMKADQRGEIEKLMKTSQEMLREDFLRRRQERLDLRKGKKKANLDYEDINFDLESKTFITRGEIEEGFSKQHINQPMIEKKAKVARSVSKADTNQFMVGRRSLDATIANRSRQDSITNSVGPKVSSNRNRAETEMNWEGDHHSSNIKIVCQDTLGESATDRQSSNKPLKSSQVRGGSGGNQLADIDEVSFDLSKQPNGGGKSAKQLHTKGNAGDFYSNSQYFLSTQKRRSQNRDLSAEVLSNLRVGQQTSPRRESFGTNSDDDLLPNYLNGNRSMWKFRITESDFFTKYMEEQARMKEEIEMQRNLISKVKRKPYQPQVKVASQEELAKVYKKKQLTKEHNANLRKNSQRYLMLKTGQLKQDNQQHHLRSTQSLKQQQSFIGGGAAVGMRRGTHQVRRTSILNQAAKQKTKQESLESPPRDVVFGMRATVADTNDKHQNHIVRGILGNTSTFGIFEQEGRRFKSRTKCHSPANQLGEWRSSLIPETKARQALINQEAAQAEKRPTTRANPVTNKHDPQALSPAKVRKTSTPSQDDIVDLNIKVPGQCVTIDQTTNSLKTGSRRATISQPDEKKTMFNEIMKKVNSIADDYIKKQRQIIEERTSKNSTKIQQTMNATTTGGILRSTFNSQSGVTMMQHLTAKGDDAATATEIAEKKSNESSCSLKTSLSLKSSQSKSSFKPKVKIESPRFPSPKKNLFNGGGGGGRKTPTIVRQQSAEKSTYLPVKAPGTPDNDSVVSDGGSVRAMMMFASAEKNDTFGDVASAASSLEKSQGKRNSMVPLVDKSTPVIEFNRGLVKTRGMGLRHHSNPNIMERSPKKAPVKIARPAAKELNERQKWQLEYKKLNSLMEQQQSIVVPDSNMPVLDMMPRADIIEDQSYSKSIPKSVKMFKFRRPFSDVLDQMPTGTQFFNAITKDAISTTKERERKYHQQELQLAKREMKISMNKTLNETKFSQFISTKGHAEKKAIEKAKSDAQKLYSKPLISDMVVSRSIGVNKSTINKQTKDRLFGGLAETFPEGTPLIQLLNLLDEQQLYKLNMKICQAYQKDLTEKLLAQDGKTIIDDDPRIRRRRPTIKENAAPAHQGPPLQRKDGHFRFKDKFETPLKQTKSRPMLFQSSTAGSMLATNSVQYNFSTVAKQTIEEDSEYAEDPNAKQHLGSQDRLGSTMVANGSQMTFGGGNPYLQGGSQMTLPARRRVNRNLAIVKEIEEKFEPLGRYQNLVSEAVEEAVGKEMVNNRSWYAQEEARRNSVVTADNNGRPSSVFVSEGGGNEQAFNQTARSAFSYSLMSNLSDKSGGGGGTTKRAKMIKREDAMKHLTHMASAQNLPRSLKENKMKADHLLFKEAQVNYVQRRKAMQKQVVIDNVHYCTLKQILDRAEDAPKETVRKKRNANIKEVAKKVIVREEKRQYKERYQEVLAERKRLLEQKAKEKKDELHGLILAINTEKDKKQNKGFFKI